MPNVTPNQSYTFATGQVPGSLIITQIAGPACVFRLIVNGRRHDMVNIGENETTFREINGARCECRVGRNPRERENEDEPVVNFEPA